MDKFKIMNEVNTSYLSDYNLDDVRGDDVDIANGLAHAQTEHSLRALKMKNDPKNHPKYSEFDGENCVECGEEIPQARLAHGFCICVDCKAKEERRSSQYAR